MADILAFWAGLVGLPGIVPWTRSSWRGLRRRLCLMVYRARTPCNDDDPAKQGRWREQRYLREFNPSSHSLDKSQPLRRLHKAFGTYRPKMTETLAEHIGLDPSFDRDFLGLKHVVLMRWRFWARGAVLGAYPSRVRRKQHGWVNSALDRLHRGRLWSEGMQHGLHLAQRLWRNKVDLVQEQEIC